MSGDAIIQGTSFDLNANMIRLSDINEQCLHFPFLTDKFGPGSEGFGKYKLRHF